MSTGDYCNYMMVIAFVEVYFCYIYRLRLVLSDLHNSDGCKTWISVQLCCRCLVAFLLSGPFWPLVWTDANKKKEKRNPCALWRSPLPILMRLLTEITICKRALLLFTHAEKKKNLCLMTVSYSFQVGFIFILLPSTDAVQSSKTIRCWGIGAYQHFQQKCRRGN